MTNEEFKAWRKSLNLTQDEAAEKLGLGRSTIIQYEQGFRRDSTKSQVDIPLVVAYACAAITHGIAPIGGNET